MDAALGSRGAAQLAPRLSMERPGRLPWIPRGLGPVGFTALLADMGWERVTRYALGPASRTNVMAQVRAAYSW